jgi:hypothetical protein
MRVIGWRNPASRREIEYKQPTGQTFSCGQPEFVELRLEQEHIWYCTSAPRVPDDDDDEISVRNGDMDSRPSILPTPVRDPEENTSDLLCVPMSPLRPMRSPSHVSLKRTSTRLSRVSPFNSM